MRDYLFTDDMSVGYRGRALIENISLHLRQGEIVTLIGPNGSGKSTILKSIIGQLPLLGGAVWLDGRDMVGMTALETAKRLSVLMTQRVRPELMTCWDVTATGRYPYTGRLGILTAQDRAKVWESLALVHGEELAHQSFSEISDGQRQRVLLARALCQEPEVLVLDEPTSFLDIRYKLELLSILKDMVEEKHLAVLMSLHELELARKISDFVVCIHNGAVERMGTPEEVFTSGYIMELFDIKAGSFRSELGCLVPGEAVSRPDMFTESGGKRLRRGYTTGTCAALAAAGAARLLLTGKAPDTGSIETPKGIVIKAALEDCRVEKGSAFCSVRKDGGDDADITDGLLITAQVRRSESGPGVTVDGGEGVGRVTKPGLDQPVGAAAINRVPRMMIEREVLAVCDELDFQGGMEVTIHVPEGRFAAEKTFNPRMGIEGGISILGTSGIVEPMSLQALADTVALELRQASALGHKRVILTPGNYGADFVRRQGMDALGAPVVKCSNFIGDALDSCAVNGFEQVLLVGHMGKLSKLAGGIMNTHSRYADCRTELFCTFAAVCGAGQETCQALLDCVSSDACIAVLDEAKLRQSVLERMLEAIDRHLARRAKGAFKAGAVLFSNEYGLLGTTAAGKEIEREWRPSTE